MECMLSNCPGSQKFKQPQPETIKCASCGEEIEIWTDEIKAVCPKCKNTIMREQGVSCLDWCKYAKECVGENTYNSYIQNKFTTLKSQLIKELDGDDNSLFAVGDDWQSIFAFTGASVGNIINFNTVFCLY